jgi:quinol monooxygenase YgiN
MTALPAREGERDIGRPFAITVAFDVVDGGFAEFHRLVSENASLSVKLEPGCLRFDVLTPLEGDGPGQVFLYEIYRDRAAFEMHLASSHYLSFDQRTRHLVARKAVLTYRVDENFKVVA